MKNNYVWESFGELQNPTIALIAPSNGIGGDEGQKIIRDIIEKLVQRGFCVMVPNYDDGNLLIQKDTEISLIDKIPRNNPDNNAQQIKDCIDNGWNMMPLMGGNGLGKIIPNLVEYYKQYPNKKNSHVKIFGFSNSTYASILASHDICHFIATPFSNIFTKPEFEEESIQLDYIMKNKTISPYSRSILQDPENKLDSVEITKHYPLNSGNLVAEADMKSRLQINITENEKWSIGLEGFIQGPDFVSKSHDLDFLDNFLEKHKNNLPQFIEIGNLATRLDGTRGYLNLRHDSSGKIIINESNIKKILSKEKSLRTDLNKIFDKITELQQKDLRNTEENQDLKILSLIPKEIFNKSRDNKPLDKQDIAKVLKSQNDAIDIMFTEIKSTALKYKVPLIHNSRFGHCANMSVVNGGLNKVAMKDNNIEMEMISGPEKSISSSSKATRVDSPNKSK